MLPRRVSGEKRPRPLSMHDQAENEHPTGFKRRQSKGLQGLFQKEPVTNSPFRRVPEPGDSPPPPAVPPKDPTVSNSSPTRPSLVTKRFHGPRTVGFNFPGSKRHRRKTVTFDERCDVLEFDRDEHEMDEEAVEEDDQYMTDYEQEAEGDYEDDQQPGQEQQLLEEEEEEDVDQVHMANDSITGLVNSMLQDTQGDEMPHTPTHENSLPHDLELQDGVPIGRTHHAERRAAYHEENYHHEDDGEDLEPPERSYIYDSTSASPATPNRSRPTTPASARGSSPRVQAPLGRTTHSERAIAGHRDELEDDVQMLPGSPSPSKAIYKSESIYRDGLIPAFSLQVKGERGMLLLVS